MLKQIEGFDHYKERKVSGFVQPDCEYTENLLENVSRCGMGFITGVNIVTDAFQHVPKTIYYRGIRLISDKRGVRMIDNWHDGGMELRFRSLRTAKVFAKGWVYDE